MMTATWEAKQPQIDASEFNGMRYEIVEKPPIGLDKANLATPNLAIEFSNNGKSFRDAIAKSAEFSQADVERGWLVDRAARMIDEQLPPGFSKLIGQWYDA